MFTNVRTETRTLHRYWRCFLPYVTPFTVASTPVLTLPIGVVDGLPVGVQVRGRVKKGGNNPLYSWCAWCAWCVCRLVQWHGSPRRCAGEEKRDGHLDGHLPYTLSLYVYVYMSIATISHSVSLICVYGYSPSSSLSSYHCAGGWPAGEGRGVAGRGETN